MGNILLISHDFSVTGAPNSLLRQAKYFKSAGYNVDVWALGGGGLLDRYTEAGFNPVIVPNTRDEIRKLYEKNGKKYDFILCNTTVTYKAVDVLQRYKTPIVWFIRETKLVEDGIAENPDFASVFKNFYNLYTVSEYAAGVSRKYNKNVRVINNAIADSFEKFTPVHNPITFGFIGSVIPVKGIDVLIKAFEQVHKKIKNTKLIIAGHYGNPFGEELHKSYNDGIVWTGEIQTTQKNNFFKDIDCLCVPSLNDPAPLTVIEGAMYGKAMIVTKNAGTNYLVNDGKSGFIIKTSNVSDTARALKAVCDGNIKSMQKASREMYLKYGGTQREKQDVLKMLAENLNNKPKVKTKIQYEKNTKIIPKFIGRIICCFLFKRRWRHSFREKYVKG